MQRCIFITRLGRTKLTGTVQRAHYALTSLLISALNCRLSHLLAAEPQWRFRANGENDLISHTTNLPQEAPCGNVRATVRVSFAANISSW